MPNFFTRKGDDGTTGVLGGDRISKDDPRIEALGSLDEASAALGVARSATADPGIKGLIMDIQRDLYMIMTEVAATGEKKNSFKNLEEKRLSWLEEIIETFSSNIEIPKEFILPGDNPSAAAISLARTVIRRAERRMVELASTGQRFNTLVLRYLNRLSSLCFILELVESNRDGNKPTLSKRSQQQ
ncbi:cob(I)yrinic acid a,c-diamide adenosyltransferase [Chloroflexota bacterium]